MAILRHLIPAGHRVLVKLRQVQYEEKTDSGLIISANYGDAHDRLQYATQEAEVIALGMNAFKGYDGGEPWCQVGDTVMIARYAGEDRKDIEEGEIYRVINDGDIIGVFKNA